MSCSQAARDEPCQQVAAGLVMSVCMSLRTTSALTSACQGVIIDDDSEQQLSVTST
jgi:hypothetical protein